MMTTAIMQPYFFPYIGYFQLINAADKFIFYDDVDFIKQGWIARNNVLVNGSAYLFSVPLQSLSSNKKINEILIHSQQYTKWHNKFIKTLKQSYNKAPYFEETVDLIQKILGKRCNYISTLAIESILEVCQYLDISTEFVFSSQIYNNAHLKAQERVLNICIKEKANRYINAIGGKELYNKQDFAKHGIQLFFIKPNKVNYSQFTNSEFIPWLSIIDILMFNSVQEVREKFLPAYQLL